MINWEILQSYSFVSFLVTITNTKAKKWNIWKALFLHFRILIMEQYFFWSFDLVDYEMNDEEEEENDKDCFNNDDDDDSDYEDGDDKDDDDCAAVFLILDLRSPQLTHQTELNFCNAP